VFTVKLLHVIEQQSG